MRGPWPCPRCGARLSTFPGSLCRPFGILPHQVSPYPRNILKSVTFHEVKVGCGQCLSLTFISRDPRQQRLLHPCHTANSSSLLKVVTSMSRLGFGQGTPRSTSVVTSSCATGHRHHLLHQSSCLCPFAGPGSCLLVGRLCRGRWAGSLWLPFCTFILLEKELNCRGCSSRRWLLWGSSEPFSFTSFFLIFLPFLNSGGLSSGRGTRAPPRFPSWALGSLATAGIRRQVGG